MDAHATRRTGVAEGEETDAVDVTGINPATVLACWIASKKVTGHIIPCSFATA
jgi:hypothetical protein